MPITLTGSSGVESPGFTQNGDPVVESGSNSDGEWTRWADGAQAARTVSSINVDITESVGNIYRSATGETATWTFPAAFAAKPEVQTQVGSTYRWSTALGGDGLSSSLSGLSATSATSSPVTAFAFGRWK